MHLRDDKDTGEAEEKHGPEIATLEVGHDGAVDEDAELLDEHPVAIRVDACEEQASLEHDEHRVEEARKVAQGVVHGVVPKGVDDRPGEDVAVVLAREARDLFPDRNAEPENKAAALILHQEHPDQ